MTRRQRLHPKRLIGRDPLPRRARITTVAAAAASILLIGVLDAATGRDLSLSVFYLIPVALVTVLVGAPAAFAIALETIPVAFIADDRLHHRPSALVLGLNEGFHLLIFATIIILLSSLQEALHAARRSEQQGQEFLGAAAHQLRGPLSGMGATAEALLLQGAHRDQEALLFALAGEAQRAGRLVGRLLRVARLDRGEELPSDVLNAACLCEEEINRARLTDPPLMFEFSCVSDEPPMVDANAESVHEALANLLDNAKRHAVARVGVAVNVNGRTIRIDVVDDGPGVPVGEEEHIFDRFVSLDGAGGTGLGLPIARAIARMNGGDLVYRNSRFSLSLPRATAEAQATPGAPPPV